MMNICSKFKCILKHKVLFFALMLNVASFISGLLVGARYSDVSVGNIKFDAIKPKTICGISVGMTWDEVKKNIGDSSYSFRPAPLLFHYKTFSEYSTTEEYLVELHQYGINLYLNHYKVVIRIEHSLVLDFLERTLWPRRKSKIN